MYNELFAQIKNFMKTPQIEKILKAILLDEMTLPDLVKVIEKEIADLYPYDHEKNSVPEACNASVPDPFSVKLKPSDEGGLVVSKIVEQVEQNLSKRQLALGYVSAILAMKKAGLDPSSFNKDSEKEKESSTYFDLLRRFEAGDFSDSKDLSVPEIMEIMSILEKVRRRK